ncbi:MAG: septal ring lytic transglycosylase RlpA family protein [Cyanobacteria bacterium J06592_8]
MKHKFLCGFAATLFLSSLAISFSSHADQLATTPDLETNEQTQTQDTSVRTEENQETSVQTEATTRSTAVKVGEYQSDSTDQIINAIATIQAHEWNNRQAATLYVRNIPVLTFVEEVPSLKEATQGNLVKVGTVSDSFQSSPDLQAQQNSDPVVRASEIAAKLNQLNHQQIDANMIGVRWDEEQQNYTIEIEGQTLVAIDSDTILPDTTKDLAEDALQATNRLRRQMGNAEPLKQIEGKPASNPLENAFNGQVLAAAQGLASWYGPGFHGNLTANGERFNQYAMTAAHRSLPFGTMVRVTNTNNGRSVVVRINDRGPFIRGRIIDLSIGAADVIGMVSNGVAPVKVEVLRSQK